MAVNPFFGEGLPSRQCEFLVISNTRFVSQRVATNATLSAHFTVAFCAGINTAVKRMNNEQKSVELKSSKKKERKT